MLKNFICCIKLKEKNQVTQNQRNCEIKFCFWKLNYLPLNFVFSREIRVTNKIVSVRRKKKYSKEKKLKDGSLNQGAATASSEPIL